MSDPQPVTFEVVAADACAEIFLIDGNFKLVKKGIGHEEFLVPPGVYKVKNRSGRVTTERMIVVREGMAPIKLDPVPLNSAVPLLYSAKTHEYHIETARHAADSPNLSLGDGSAIVILARQWTAPAENPPPAAPVNPARGLTLLDMTGAVLVDVEAQTKANDKPDPCVSLDVALNPGSYRLSLAYDDGRRVEQTLIASPGWQTQVYLLVDGNADKDAARADLINSSITMRKPGVPFDPEDPELRGEEIARGALHESRKILSDEIRSLITSSNASPMLALIGAHLLIRETNEGKERGDSEAAGKKTVVDNRDALRRIVENLRKTIGRHPDVEAIAIAAGNPDPSFVFDVPPMFRASWPLLLKASVERPDSIPTGSINTLVAERIWGEGPWLLWLGTSPDDKVDRAALWQTRGRELLLSIGARERETMGGGGGVAAAMAVPAGSMASVVTAGAATALKKVKSFFTLRSRTPFPDLHKAISSSAGQEVLTDLQGIGTALTDDQRTELVQRLGIPLSSIDAWLRQIGK